MNLVAYASFQHVKCEFVIDSLFVAGQQMWKQGEAAAIGAVMWLWRLWSGVVDDCFTLRAVFTFYLHSIRLETIVAFISTHMLEIDTSQTSR
jgi:hypothetical protein